MFVEFRRSLSPPPRKAREAIAVERYLHHVTFINDEEPSPQAVCMPPTGSRRYCCSVNILLLLAITCCHMLQPTAEAAPAPSPLRSGRTLASQPFILTTNTSPPPIPEFMNEVCAGIWGNIRLGQYQAGSPRHVTYYFSHTQLLTLTVIGRTDSLLDRPPSFHDFLLTGLFFLPLFEGCHCPGSMQPRGLLECILWHPHRQPHPPRLPLVRQQKLRSTGCNPWPARHLHHEHPRGAHNCIPGANFPDHRNP